MLKHFRYVFGIAALALTIGATSAFAQQDRNMSSESQMTSGSSATASYAPQTGWSHRYQLTPLEHKRLRAFGLTDEEVFVAANAAAASGVSLDAPSFDDPATMILRGRSFQQIASDLGVPVTTLDDRRPEWQTAEWKQATDEGWFIYHRPTTSETSTTTRTHERRRTTIETTPTTPEVAPANPAPDTNQKQNK